MKDLLTDIVEKMSHNLEELTPTIGSVTSQEQMTIDNNASCSKVNRLLVTFQLVS